VEPVQITTGPVRPDTLRLAGEDTPIGLKGVVVGRGEDCDLKLDTRQASRHHARIYVDPRGCWIRDLKSTNGTLVNGERVGEKPRQLANGDLIKIGEVELMALAGDKTTYEPFDPEAPVEAPPGGGPVKVGERPITIGRDASNALVLDDPNVSRFHAIVTPTAKGATLKDLSSRNGTRVGGELVSEIALSPGAEIAIGGYRLTFTGTELIPRDDRVLVHLESRGVGMKVGDKLLLAPTSILVEPGELVAIIGESGAGKTTLLKALAGITQPTAGEVLINDEPVATRLTDIGYVPQDDIVHRLLTVREALRYAAQLRLPPDTSDTEIEAAVDRVLSELDLEPHADKLVKNVSGGQRKRVGVAVELLSRPGILFLDEPGTGLDPGLEKRLMELLHELSRDSRPIVTITHSTKHLDLCDKLAVMAAGGVLVYYGPPQDALSFFEVAEYDDIYTALDEQPVERWIEDPRRLTMYPPPHRPGVGRGRPSRERQPAVVPQAKVLAERYKTLLLRDRRNLAILLGQVPLLALLIAIGFSRNTFDPFAGLRSAPTFLFVTTITALWLGSIASAREVVKERSVFLRERAVGVSVSAYVLSKIAVLFVLGAVQVAILSVILFVLRPLHASGSAYAGVFALLLLTSFAAIGMGLLASTLARSEDQSTSFIPLFLIPQLLFGGALIPLAGKSFVIKALAALMISRWSFEGLGNAIHLNDQPWPASHYPGFFHGSVVLPLLLIVVFGAAFVGVVFVRHQTQRDSRRYR
jgi:ABC-type multidrug transport system ATPase subunit/ABC-type multidrug transport system permease subunit